METEGVQITTLIRLWNAAGSLERLRGVSGGALESGHPMASPDPLLWTAFDFRLLDVRAADAFTARHLPDAVSIPADELIGRLFELPPRWRTLVVVSDAPDIAVQTASELRDRGWLRATPLVEPLRDWPGPWESGPARRVLWEPTPIVRRWAAMFPSGPVCDLGCGAGRDSVYLAMRGHAVTAIDVLPDALKMTQGLAARMGVAVRTQLLNLRRERPADGPWSALLMLRFLERDLFRWIAEHLAPGGLFLFESFTQDQVRHGTPRRQKRTVESQAPLRMFCDLARAGGSAADLAATQAPPVAAHGATQAPPVAAHGATQAPPVAAHGATQARAADSVAAHDGRPRFDILEYLETRDLSGDYVARLVVRRAGEEPVAGPAADAPHGGVAGETPHGQVTHETPSDQEADDGAHRDR